MSTAVKTAPKPAASKPEAKPAAAPAPKPKPEEPKTDPVAKQIFQAAELAEYFERLKAEGEEGEQWWKKNDAIVFAWENPYKGNNNTQWVNVTLRSEKGIEGWPNIRFNGEVHAGQIMPKTEEGLAELAKTTKLRGKDKAPSVRTMDPTINIQKWNAKVQTDKDGITILTDKDGNQILPPDEKLSPLYRFLSLLYEAFSTEAQERIDRAEALYAKADAMKKANKAVTSAEVLAAFTEENGPIGSSSLIISKDQQAKFLKLFPSPKDSLTSGAIVCTTTKIAGPFQLTLSSQNQKNAGMPLANPLVRAKLDFDDAGLAITKFFDKDKPFNADGKVKYEEATVDDLPVTDETIHKFVKPRSKLDGLLSVAVCFSSLALSMTVKAKILVVAAAKVSEVDVGDIIDDDPDIDISTLPVGPSKPAAAQKPAATNKPAAAASKPETKPKVAAPPPAEEEPVVEDEPATEDEPVLVDEETAPEPEPEPTPPPKKTPAAKPAATKPATTPAATKPAATPAPATKPAATKPAAAKPVATPAKGKTPATKAAPIQDEHDIDNLLDQMDS